MFYSFFIFVLALSSCTHNVAIQTSGEDFSFDWNNEVTYFVLVDRFFNGDLSNDTNVNTDDILAYHGGDFKGMLQKFDYISDLGVSDLLFTPMMDNRNRDFFGHWGAHGYWIIDHFSFDEHLGDLNSFSKLKKKIAQKKMGFLIDIVLNHVDWDHPWVKNKKQWFHKLESIQDWNDPVQLTKGRVTGLPDLDQDNPEVYETLLRYTYHWLELSDARGIRLDAIKHIGHDFWKKYIMDVKKFTLVKNKTKFIFLGELMHGDPRVYLPYVDDGMNAFYNYPLYYTFRDIFTHGTSLFKLPARLQEMEELFPRNILWVNFLDNHDLPRFLSLTRDTSVENLHFALSTLMTIKGMPLIYYGTEEEMLGKSGELGRKSLTFHKTRTYDFIKNLISIRKKYKVLSTGKRVDRYISDNQYIFTKSNEKRDALVIVNRNIKGDVSVFGSRFLKDFFNESRKDLISGEIFNSDKELKLSANRVYIFIKNRSAIYVESKKRYAKITFSVDDSSDSPLFLIGNRKEIGAWAPSKSIGPLRRIGKSKVISLTIPFSKVLEYKFIHKVNGKIIWESRANRFHFVTKDKEIKLKWNN